MNQSKHGLFALILLFSFVVHTLLIIKLSIENQTANRYTQGQFILSQCVTDSTSDFIRKDRVGLANLANRYIQLSGVAEIRFVDATPAMLVKNGLFPLRDGFWLEKQVLLDDKPIGKVQLKLYRDQASDILRTQWIYFLMSFMIHVFVLFCVIGLTPQRQ